MTGGCVRHIITGFLVLYLTTVSAWGATADQSTGRIVVHHNDGSIDIQNGAAELVSRDQLRTGLAYRIRPSEMIDVIIDDPNPLLYTYEWKLGALKNSDNYDAAQKFANAINPALGILKGLTGIPRDPGSESGRVAGKPGCEELSNEASQAICGAGIDNDFVSAYAAHYESLHDFTKKIPGWIKNSAGSKANGDKVKKAVSEHPAVVNAKDIDESIKKIKSARNAAITAIRKRSSASWSAPRPILVASLVPVTALALELEPQSNPGTGGALPPPGTVIPKNDDKKPTTSPKKPQPKKSKLAQDNERLLKQVKELEEKIAAENKKKEQDAIDRDARLAAERRLVNDFDVLSDTVRDAEDALKAVNAFVPLVEKINVPLSLGTLPYNAKQVQPATLTIKPVPANASAVDTDVKTGEFAFSFQAFNPVNYYVDAGPVYSFIERPEFKTEEVAGKHRIVRSDDGDAVNGATVGAMLTLVPRAWNDPTFGGGFQIGISPESDKLGFYLGAVVRMFDLVSLGGGLVYQQTQKLAPGQSIGQDLDAAGDLDTNTVFKAGPYVSISIKIK
jgi:hypothetical protein